MSTPRFFCERIDRGDVVLDAEQSRHARASLRLREGDAVELFDGRGALATGHIASAAGRGRRAGTTVQVEHVERVPAPIRRLTLVTAACKGSRLNWLVEKCTELGVSRLCFAEFERAVVRLGSGHLEKLNRVALAACRQCGRLWAPALSVERDAASIVAETADGSIVAHPAGDTATISGWLRGVARHDVTAVIGPEGGLTGAELAALRDVGATPVRLAETTLRIETAAVAVAAAWAGA